MRVVRAVGLYLTLASIALISVLPFAWALGGAFRDNAELFRYVRPLSVWTFVPRKPTVAAFAYIFTVDRFHRPLANSTVVGLAVSGLGLVVNSLAGFGFARFRFRGRDAMFTAVLVSLMMPFEIVVIPLYLVILEFGWVDSFRALIIPAVADAFSIFLLRQAFREIPQELIDSARIDGCGWLFVYWRIALPLIRPTLLTASLLAFVRQWDAFFWPLVATSSPEYTVVQVAVHQYVTEYITFWDRLLAASVSASVPVLMLYFLLQRYYVQGTSTTGFR